MPALNTPIRCMKNDFHWGTFGLMAEFGIMGVLPDMAHDVGISIPAAGNMIAGMPSAW